MTDLRDIIGDDSSRRARAARARPRAARAGRAAARAPPAPEHAPEPPSARVIPFPRRYRYTALAAAAVAACALFGIGYLVGGGPRQDPIRTVAMSGASQATAELALFEKDTAGNWPMGLVSAASPRVATSSG